MPKFTFIGSNASGFTEYGPYRFVSGEAVDVPASDEDTCRRLRGSREFEADPFDHDGDGKPGGSLPDSPVSLANKNKAELIKIAAAEGVEVEEGATNNDIKAAIEAARKE